MKRIVRIAWMYGFVSAWALGCAGNEPRPEPPVYLEATQEEPKPVPPKVVAVPVATPVPGQLRPMPPMKAPTAEEIDGATKAAAGREVWEVIDEANAKAASDPIEEGFYNSVQVYDYAPGILFQVYAAPMKLTAVQFAPGEEVVSVAIGDSVRWVVGQTTSGTGSEKQEVVLIKPVRSGLHTNVLVTTHRRVYQLELHSYRETYMASVSWNYPGDLVKRYEQESTAAEQTASEEGPEVGTDVANLNFDYGFVVEDKDELPSWMPRRVYDDGVKTYVQFPPNARTQELPVLFVLSKKGTPQIVNFRVRGDYMIVDRVFELAQLRLGEDDPITVGIEKRGGE